MSTKLHSDAWTLIPICVHDPDTYGDQPRRLIIQPELTSKLYWTRLKTVAGESTSSLHCNFKFRNILEINQLLKQEFRRIQKAVMRSPSRHWHRVSTSGKSPQRFFIFLVTNFKLVEEDLGPLKNYVEREESFEMK